MLCHNSGTVLRGQPGRRSSEDGSELCLHAPIQARHSLPGPTRGRHTTFRGLLADTRVQVCPHRLTPTRWLGGGMTPLVGDIRCTPLRVEAAVVPLLQGGAVWLEGAGWPLSCTWGPESHRRERQARGCPVWTQLSVCGQPPQRPSPPVPLQTAPRFFGGPPPHTQPHCFMYKLSTDSVKAVGWWWWCTEPRTLVLVLLAQPIPALHVAPGQCSLTPTRGEPESGASWTPQTGPPRLCPHPPHPRHFWSHLPRP